MADLQQHANAVADFAGGVLTGPMLQTLHNGQRVGYDLVAGNAVNADNRADAAGIMLILLGIKGIFHNLSSLFVC